MVAQVKPTTKNSPPVKVGANRDNLPADAYAARGKEGYAEFNARANMSKLDTLDVSIGNMSKSAGNIGVKTEGITMRGHGAATKGIKSRGPMA
jgi:hypothetical protein